MRNASQGGLQAALDGGGTVAFSTGGTITLTNTLTIARETGTQCSSNPSTPSRASFTPFLPRP